MVKRLVLLVFTLALGAALSCDYAGPGGASTTMKASPPTIERTPGTAGASTTMEAAPATTERTPGTAAPAFAHEDRPVAS